MTTACYVSRSERGGALRMLRLVAAGRADATWHAPPMDDDPDTARKAASDAAAWLADELSRVESAGSLGVLCLDADGSLCSWVASGTGDAETIAATVRLGGADAGGEFDDDLDTPTGSGGEINTLLSLSPDAASATTATIEPLAVDRFAPSAERPTRLPTLALADVPARLLLDELDALGVEVGRVDTVWHAAARAWNATGGARRGERVVAEAGDTAAVVLVDAEDGRLNWSWADDGELIACGSLRLTSVRHNNDDGQTVTLDAAALSRLATEWLAWGAQTGASPRTVALLMPEESYDDAGVSLGHALERTWAEATFDVMQTEDAVGETLTRLVSLPTTGSGVRSLTFRPGRAHRAMHRWLTISMLLIAAVLGIGAWQVWGSIGDIEQLDAERKQAWSDLATAYDPASTGTLVVTEQFLERRRRELRNTRSPADDVRPVLQELESLSYVLSAPDFAIDRLSITPISIILRVNVADIPTYEFLAGALNEIQGSQISSWSGTLQATNDDTVDAQFTGTWESQ
ncbi:MAG: hypothetical protein AAF747_02490 [Planctomycetota bacterium]